MKDFGKSSDPAVQAQLDRLAKLSLPEGRLGLDTIRELLSRLGNPHRTLPPVFHVAGTNGKGSVCAFLRAMLEADGKRVHVTTSPHLVRYNERIRVAGKLIEDARLAELLEEVLDAAVGLAPSFFEVTIAAAFTEFARVPADACVVEVGLGGRFDATNVLEPEVLAACGIAALGIDHEKFLLAPEEGVPEEPMARIAFEKAGIAKKSVPLVTLGNLYSQSARDEIARRAARERAPLRAYGRHWHFHPKYTHEGFDHDADQFVISKSSLAGEHQYYNAALADRMLHYQNVVECSEEARKRGLAAANWPARMQLLAAGPLTALASDRSVWLDGGHNPSAGEAVARQFEHEYVHLILGMLDNKDPASFTAPLGGRIRSLTVVPVPGQDAHPAEAFGPDAIARDNVEDALLNIPSDDHPILIAGSLYLAGEVLQLNDETPE